MSTWTQLNDELKECERQITAIRLKSQEKVAKEEERLALVEKKRAECVQAHRRNVADATSERDQQLENVRSKAAQQVRLHSEARDRAQERTRAATERAEAAESRQRELEKELLALRRTLDATLLEEERKAEEMKAHTDMEVSAKMAETDAFVCDIARYASEVQNGIVATVEDMHEEHKVQVKQTEDASRARSRYVQLHNTAVAHATREIPTDQLHRTKAELSEDWQNDWVRTVRGQGRRPLWTDNLEALPSPLRPGDPSSPRPADLARRKAVERQVQDWKRDVGPLGERDVKHLADGDAEEDDERGTGEDLPRPSDLGSPCDVERGRSGTTWRGSSDVRPGGPPLGLL